MRTRRYTEAQVFRILQEVDSGVAVVDAARVHGVSPATIHRWKGKYAGISLSELKRLKALEEENARLKRIMAQQAMDIELLREINAKNGKPFCQEVSSRAPDGRREVLATAGMCLGGYIQVLAEVCWQETER